MNLNGDIKVLTAERVECKKSECIDKAALLEFLENDLDFHRDNADGEYAYQKWLISNHINGLMRLIESGVFDA